VSFNKKLARLLAAVLASAGVACLPLIAAIPANAATATVTPGIKVCGTGAAVRQPASIILTCADHGMIAKGLRWTSWTGTGATATATVTWRVTSADAGQTTADITLASPAREAGGEVLFTALRLHVTGATPHGFIRDATFNEAPAPAQPPAHAMTPAGRAGAEPRASGGSGQIITAAIEGYWVLAGGQSTGSVAVSGYGTYTYPQLAAAITGAESSFIPGNILPGEPYAVTGWGLWQITPGNSEPAYGVDFQLLDPWNNAEAAVAKYDANGFLPWTTYTSGAYESYLQYVQGVVPETALTDPGQYEPYNGPAPAGTHNASSPGLTYGPPIG
jgi:hypothetical protein